jgi:PAS domain S-box-containing protein
MSHSTDGAHLAPEELHKLRRTGRSLAEVERLSHIASWAWDLASGDVFWSVEHFRICGVDPRDFKPTLATVRALIHKDDVAPTIDRFNRAIGERSSFECDLRFVRPDGSIRYVRSLAHPVFNDRGELTEYVGSAIDTTEQRRMEQDRMDLVGRAMRAQEDERRRIAREMHDQLGERMSALTMTVAALRALAADHPQLSEHVDTLERIMRALEKDVSILIRELRPPALDDLGLAAALGTLVKTWEQHSAIHAHLRVTGLEGDRLSPEAETTLYRITQEALTNVAKHSGATHVAVILERRQDDVSLIVEDDGVGFDQAAVPQAGTTWGLVGMSERAALVGGSLEVESRPGAGVTIVVCVPLSPGGEHGGHDA